MSYAFGGTRFRFTEPTAAQAYGQIQTPRTPPDFGASAKRSRREKFARDSSPPGVGGAEPLAGITRSQIASRATGRPVFLYRFGRRPNGWPD